jgi:hypothetical protein
MAKASWNVLNKTSGTGNGSFTSGGSIHTGRLNRASTTTVAATGVTSKLLISIQLAAGNTLSVATPATVARDGNSAYELGFESNAIAFDFNLSGTGFSLSYFDIDTGSVVNRVTDFTGNHVAPSAPAGDPGATAKYTGKLTLAVTANPTVATRSATLTITPYYSGSGENLTAGTPVTKTITQAAGDPTLSISPQTVTIPADGTPQTVNVASNTSWTLS